ncbi:MAG: hypothetical protein K2H20_01195, partial [Bacilli bacterium]|nr:hypothetical protein [Bacilli bacterium]
YYIRLFKKLDKNNLNKEEYPLAFSSTIYGDKKTQITFTDNIHIENITDNRGRPLTELFLTIIKNNRGFDKWYFNNIVMDKDVEYSHCFGEISCGFDLYFEKSEDKEKKTERREKNGKYSDVKTLNKYLPKNGWENCDLAEVSNINLYEKITDENVIYKGVYIGDIVEFNITTCNETVLEDTYFRFNTYLRENPNNHFKFIYDVIESDDYDSNDFNGMTYKEGVKIHPEGYFYKAHYPIQLKEFDSEIHQTSHYDLKIKNVYLDSVGDKVFLFVQTTLPHKLQENDLLLICDDERDRILRTNVTYVKNHLIFAISDVGQFTCTDMYKVLSGKISDITFNLRRYNSEIPLYAEKIPYRNAYLWRNVNTVGNKNNTKLPEYTFNNGCFYINQEINFFLKRQDPFGEVGLYYDGSEGGYVPNDIYGMSLITFSEPTR